MLPTQRRGREPKPDDQRLDQKVTLMLNKPIIEKLSKFIEEEGHDNYSQAIRILIEEGLEIKEKKVRGFQ